MPWSVVGGYPIYDLFKYEIISACFDCTVNLRPKLDCGERFHLQCAAGGA